MKRKLPPDHELHAVLRDFLESRGFDTCSLPGEFHCSLRIGKYQVKTWIEEENEHYHIVVCDRVGAPWHRFALEHPDSLEKLVQNLREQRDIIELEEDLFVDPMNIARLEEYERKRAGVTQLAES